MYTTYGKKEFWLQKWTNLYTTYGTRDFDYKNEQIWGGVIAIICINNESMYRLVCINVYRIHMYTHNVIITRPR